MKILNLQSKEKIESCPRLVGNVIKKDNPPLNTPIRCSKPCPKCGSRNTYITTSDYFLCVDCNYKSATW